MIKKGIFYKFFMIFAVLVLFSCKNQASLTINHKETDSEKDGLDITEIQIDDQRFLKGKNLGSLEGREIKITSSGSLKIILKAKGSADLIKLYLDNASPQINSFENGIAIFSISNVSGNIPVKLEIIGDKKNLGYLFSVDIRQTASPANPPNNNSQIGSGDQQPQPPAKPPVAYNPAENHIPEILVSSIKIVPSDTVPVNNDPGTVAFDIKLTVGSDYIIKTEVLPEDAHNKELSYSIDKQWKDCISLSEKGVLTVLKKPLGSNMPYVRIESKGNSSVGINLRVDVLEDSNPIIKDWSLTGDDVVPDAANNQIKVSGDKASNAHVKFTRGSTTSYKVDVIPSGSINIETISDGNKEGDVNEYKITIKKNNTVWEKKSSIFFYTEVYNQTKARMEKKTLKTISITQEGNRNFKKNIQWLEGVKPPAADALKNIKPFDYAEWKEDVTTTWFGVRKVSYTTNGNYDDTKMCWAITAANMLHWWFTQNENEIAAYKQKHGITENSSNGLYYNNKYHRGLTEDESTKSSFASLLRLGFKDDGNPVQTALKWYLEGTAGLGNIQDKAPPLLFEGVLNSSDSIVTFATLNNQNDVNTLFKKAIENNEAMAVSYEFGGGNYPRGHVVTVWGISLDGDGNVFELWVADSDAGGHLKIPYLYNMGIHYGDDGRPKMVNLSTGTATHNKFSDITTLKLGKDKFK